MKTSKTEQFKQRIADVASQAYVGYRSGEFNTTRSKMRTSMESVGIIDSILTVDSVLYVIAYRAEPITQFSKDHENVEVIKEYYNCQGDINAYSVYELLMPITNIDLKREVLDPRTLIGSKVMVSEINGLAVKAELITNIDEFNDWLQKPMWGLDEKPIDFLNTSGGVDLIIDRLERMAQGYPL